jgi:hypothetical protein
MNGCKHDLTVHPILIHRERRNRVDLIANGNRGDILADRIHGTHRFIAKSSRELDGLDVLILTPHRLGTIQSNGFHPNAHLPGSRFGNIDILKPQYLRPSGL